jgi:osmotically inducible lipoprotein OsmB
VEVHMPARMGLIASAMALALAACGNSPGDRAISGGAIGAGAGAVGGALLGAPLAGAALGGAAGAAAGGLTSPGQIDLGKPVWER